MILQVDPFVFGAFLDLFKVNLLSLRRFLHKLISTLNVPVYLLQLFV